MSDLKNVKTLAQVLKKDFGRVLIAYDSIKLNEMMTWYSGGL